MHVTFKDSTIRSAFQKLIWPISCNTAIEKLRTYSQPIQPTTPTLLRPITPIPSTFQEVELGLQRWKDRLPEAWSSPSKQSYSNWVTGAQRVLAASQLQELDLRAVRQQVKNSKKKRGPGAGADSSVEAQKLAATEARKLSQAQKQLHRAGIEARKQERLRKKSLAQLTELGLPIPPELVDPITDPEAETESEYESASEGGRGSGCGSESESGNEEVIIS
ncbi:hypothetical protein GMDG_00248 [Pseudogymnoascus destructans 20631-21]|uniref:Uncharacterized protein n=1 Tax=Pseudogymnoascus destructans (strain ATCC MYA-4855 / 20631-21) TaxID=658429 RepID=L8FZ45_PSED2|nr:hypothetical protein GMDG_00248 [Pseudogymnoascus destructans 20631-21]